MEKKTGRFMEYMKERWKKRELTKEDSYLIPRDESVIQRKIRIRFDEHFTKILLVILQETVAMSKKKTMQEQNDLKESLELVKKLHSIAKEYKKPSKKH